MRGETLARPGSASRPLDPAELLELHAWCRAHNVVPECGDRPSERDAALRQWARVEVVDYKPRSPAFGIDELRRLWREAETTRGDRRDHVHRVRPWKRAERLMGVARPGETGDDSTPDILAVLAMLRDELRRLPWNPTGLLALYHFAAAYRTGALLPAPPSLVLPLGRTRDAHTAKDAERGAPHGWFVDAGAAVVAACAQAAKRHGALATRQCLDECAYAALAYLVDLPEGTARRVANDQHQAEVALGDAWLCNALPESKAVLRPRRLQAQAVKRKRAGS